MKDKLEQLVKENREAFDDKNPGPGVWNKIAQQLDDKPTLHWLWKVAAIVFFLTTVGLATQLNLFSNTDTIVDATQPDEFEAVEGYYFELISEKKSMIYDYEEQNVNIDQDFEQDLQKLDAMYLVLKEEMETNPSKKVADALILNLLVRIDILNEQLKELDDTDDELKESEVNV